MNKILAAFLVTVFSSYAMKTEEPIGGLRIKEQLDTLYFLQMEAQENLENRKATHEQSKSPGTEALLKEAEESFDNITRQIEELKAELEVYEPNDKPEKDFGFETPEGEVQNNEKIATEENDYDKLLNSMLKTREKKEAERPIHPIIRAEQPKEFEEKEQHGEKFEEKQSELPFESIKSKVNASLQKRVETIQTEKTLYDGKIEKLNDSGIAESFFKKSKELIDNYNSFFTAIVSLSEETLHWENDERIEDHINSLSRTFNTSKDLKHEYEEIKNIISQKYNQKIEQEKEEARRIEEEKRIERERIEEQERIERERIEGQAKEEEQKKIENAEKSKSIDTKKITNAAKKLGISDEDIKDMFYSAEILGMDLKLLFEAAIKEKIKKTA